MELNYYFKKWLPVKNLLAFAGADSTSDELFQVGLPASGGSFPYFFASGHSNPATGAPRLSTGLVQGITATTETLPDFPRTDCIGSLCTISYEGMNTLVADYLLRPEFKTQERRVGIVTIDFPGPRLIATIASINRGAVFNRPSFNYEMSLPNGQRYVPGAWTNRPVTLTPRCSFPLCTGTPASVSTDAPTGVSYTMTGGGRSVQFMTSPVRMDTLPPTAVAAATTLPNAAGWYRNNVVVHFTCTDAGGSGIADCPSDQVLSTQVSATSTAKTAYDVAGNKSGPSNVVTVRIDRTPPRVTYTGNLGSYSMAQVIDIRCEAIDRESGLNSSTCVDIRGPAASFGPGVHKFSASAADLADNTASGATSFTVVALPGDVNSDGAVDCRDLAVVKAAFGKRTGMVGFDARADINADGVVDIKDLSFVSRRLPVGQHCT